MTRIAFFLIVMFAFFHSGCSTTRKTTATDTKTEAQLTATTDRQTHTETAGHSAIITDVKTDERQNVIIDFAKVEFYPDGFPSFPSDSTAADWLKAVAAAATTEEGQKAKPPNVKSATKGRITINGEKQHGSETKVEVTTTAATESQSQADVAADSKTEDRTKTDETKKPCPGFWGWNYFGVFAVVCVVLFFYFRRHWRKK